MTNAFHNPALAAFLDALAAELTVAQVRVRRTADGFELRHEADDRAADGDLRPLSVAELCALATHADNGAFRPLRAAPNLRRGWRCKVGDAAELELALNRLYPGFLADWFAALTPPPPVTNYRPFVERQTGMYRLAAKLNDAQAAQTIRACCHARFCLKRRLWTVAGLAPDPPTAKSMIPCLEPCALLLEFARKSMRLEQEEKMTVDLSPSDLRSVLAALDWAAQHPPPDLREADFADAANPRRLRRVAEKLRARLPAETAGQNPDERDE